MVLSLLNGAGHEHVDAAQRGGAGGADVRDLAADSQKLAIAMASKTPDAQYTVQRLLTDHSPAVKGIHESLLAITAKIDLEVKTRREELLAVAKMCTLVAAASVVVVSQEHEQERQRHQQQRQHEQRHGPSGKGTARSATRGSGNNGGGGGGGGGGSERMVRLLDVGSLRECVEALGFLVGRNDARRRTLLRRSGSSSIKDEIADLNGRVLEAAREMGLAGILAVFKGVLEDTGGGYGSSPGGIGDVLTQQEVDLARQPKRSPPRARVPSLLPRRESWHVRRELVIGTVLRSLLSAPGGSKSRGGSSSGDGYTASGGGRAGGGGRKAGPRVVGLVGESGTGKTATAAEIVRGPEVLEYFSDGVVWLPVNEGDGNRDRLPSLMKRLARMMYKEVGIKHGFGAPPVGDAGAGASSDDPWGGPRHGGGSGSGAADDGGGGGGAAYVKALVEGGGQQQQQAAAAAADGHGGPRQRRPLRCLVAVDNVCEAEVVATLAETGVWILLTTRDGDVIRRVGGKPVAIGRLLETDADWVLRRASELPGDEPPPAGARELIELCGRTVLDLAFVGRWSTVCGRKDPMAWRDAADSIRAELNNLELTREDDDTRTSVTVARKVGGGGAEEKKLLLRQQSTASCSTIEDGAPASVISGSEASSFAPSSTCFSSTSSSSSRAAHHGRESQRKAILRAGFRDLVGVAGDDDSRLLYLSLAVLPDGHEFTVKDAAVLLHGDGSARCGDGMAAAAAAGGDKSGEKREEKAARRVLRVLEARGILAASGGRGERRRSASSPSSFRMHEAHSGFAREILLDCPKILGWAVGRWVGFLSSLDAVLFFDPVTLARLWSAVENVGGNGWRDGQSYETALEAIDNYDPLCRVCLVAVAKFRSAEGDWDGASVMWRRLLTVEQRAQEPNVMYPVWELVNAAEKGGKPEEAAAWRRYGRETLNLAMVKSTMVPPETGARDSGGGGGIGGSSGGGGGGYPTKSSSSGGPKRSADTASVLRSLALNIVRFGPSHGVEAEMMLRRALEIEVARRGPDDPQVAVTLERLGVCVRQAGRLKEAEQLLRRALTIEEARLGEDDPRVARTLFHLGVCLRVAGRLEEAEEVLWRALDIETEGRGADDLTVARTLHALGLCAKLSSQGGGGGGGGGGGALEEATELFSRALAIREAKLQPDDASVGQTLFELGVCLRRDGRVQEAEAFLRRALGIKEAAAALEAEGAVAATGAGGAGPALSRRSNSGSSGAGSRGSTGSSSSNRNGVDEDSVGMAMFHLGICVLQGGRRLEEAETLLRNALDVETKRLGSDDVSVARIAFQHGVCLRRSGRREEAETVLGECVKTLEASLGAGHEEVAAAKSMLDSCAATE